MKRCLLLALIFQIILIPCVIATDQYLHGQSELSTLLRQFGLDARMRSASWGFLAVDANSGDTIASVNPHEALVPASTLKILTTATALDLLGTNFRFHTLLAHSGNVSADGTLHGDLIIKGSGDPAFGYSGLGQSYSLDSVFAQWHTNLRLAGINKINGRVFVDESIFDLQMIPRVWLWEDMGNHYGAGTSGMSVLNNYFTIYFAAGDSVGKPAAVIRTEPEIPGLVLQNSVTTGLPGSGDQVWIFGAPYQMERLLTGTVPLGQNSFAVRGSLPDPPGYVAKAFSEFLHRQGIAQSGPSSTYRQSQLLGQHILPITDTLGVWVSPALKHIAAHTNLESDNSFAESLLKIAGKRLTTHPTTASGALAMRNYWQAKGLDTRGMFVFDGSGLAPSNRITAGQLTHILIYATRQEWYRQFVSGLPLAGRTGTLVNNFRNMSSEGVLMAKTGTLSHVRAFAGYTGTLSGRKIAFTFIVNHFQGTGAELRNEMITILDAITRYNQ